MDLKLIEEEFEKLSRAVSELIALVRASGRYDSAVLAEVEIRLHWCMAMLRTAMKEIQP